MVCKLIAKKQEWLFQNSRQEVTGIVVNYKMQIPKIEQKHIRQQVYYIKKHGLDSHLKYIGEIRSNYLSHLIGKVNFGLFINPKDIELQESFSFLKNYYYQAVSYLNLLLKMIIVIYI